LQQLLEDANQSLEESGTPSHEIVVVVLHRADVNGQAATCLGLGITLAGGADYETKEITVKPPQFITKLAIIKKNFVENIISFNLSYLLIRLTVSESSI